MTESGHARRRGGLLLVHAHPDDETLTTGGTMAHYAAAGVPVTLVTCTLGQRGEILPSELAHLTPDELGTLRRRELAEAMRALGVSDHRLLGAGRWRDSGMVWVRPGIAGVAPDADPLALGLADVDEIAAALVQVLDDVRPRAVVTYDPDGGYGHPDHIAAHRATMRAVELYSGSADLKVYWVRTPRSWAERDRARLLGGRPASMAAREADDPMPPVVVPDDVVTTVLDVGPQLARKIAALRAHATQLTVDPPYYALTDNVAQLIAHGEAFQLVSGRAGPPGPLGYEDDLLG